MTEDDLERRLRHMLTERATQLRPTMSGPELRSRAVRTSQSRHRIARVVGPALAAAAIVVIAVASFWFSGRDNGSGRQQPGTSQLSTVAPTVPSVPTVATTSPTTPFVSRVPTPSTTPAPSSPPLSSAAGAQVSSGEPSPTSSAHRPRTSSAPTAPQPHS